MNRREITELLDNPAHELQSRADTVRRKTVGDEVHLRALVEFSNICSRRCLYCGINADMTDCARYSMGLEEIVRSAVSAADAGYPTVVLQSGENRNLDTRMLAGAIEQIKNKTSLAVTLSVGQWPYEIYKLWKNCGADRFLLRFETSDDRLYRRLHPDSSAGVAERYKAMEMLADLGYEIGSGVMIGLDGQSFETLADDIIKIASLGLHMVGAGPYIPHSGTGLSKRRKDFVLDDAHQVLPTEEMVCKVMAIIRILCPEVNIPATTALAVLNPKSGYENGLKSGCNVVMPNSTPPEYRCQYNLYPGKAQSHDETFEADLKQRIENIGRTVSTGRGDSLKFIEERKAFTEK